MKLKKRKPSGREKDKASIKLLEELRDKLYSDDASISRRAAFNLSWLQEDGLEILREALFSDFLKATRSAASYGLRSMRGRMKKAASEVLRQGLNHQDVDTKELCKTALLAMTKKTTETPPSKKKKKGQVGKSRTKGMRGRGKRKRKSRKKQKGRTNFHQPRKP